MIAGSVGAGRCIEMAPRGLTGANSSAFRTGIGEKHLVGKGHFVSRSAMRVLAGISWTFGEMSTKRSAWDSAPRGRNAGGLAKRIEPRYCRRNRDSARLRVSRPYAMSALEHESERGYMYHKAALASHGGFSSPLENDTIEHYFCLATAVATPPAKVAGKPTPPPPGRRGHYLHLGLACS